MYLIEDKRTNSLVFTVQNPRLAGYEGEMVEDVSLDYDMDAVHDWPDGAAAPEVVVGRSKSDPRQYKVFRYSHEVETAGYQAVPGSPLVFVSFGEYARISFRPEYMSQMPESNWFQHLDEIDNVAPMRRRVAVADEPESSDRNEVAAWIAHKHFLVDSSIREIWYLPLNAPDDEIRLLELNDRVPLDEDVVEPVDFALDIEGASFRLFVADVSSEQLAQINKKSLLLPSDWSLDEATIWRRGA